MIIEEQSLVLDRLWDWVFTCDSDGYVTSMNRAARNGFNCAERCELNLTELVLSESRSRWLAFLSSPNSPAAEFVVLTQDGRRVYLECRCVGTDKGRQVVARDMTAMRRMEEQLEQAQKREAIGILAGGIAHDFNNLLTGIVGYADLLKLEAKPGEHLHEALTVIQKAAEQAVQLTTQLLNYTRRGRQEYVAVDAQVVIREVIALLRRTIDKTIVVETDFHTTDAHILGDAGQLHQVLLNLALNAKDAMPRGGKLSFRTEHRVPPMDLPLESVPYMVIEVCDTGIGIPPESVQRIFDPFFTTKPAGHGTGMGLAMVSGIVKNHSGAVQVKSSADSGTTFTLYLPLAPKPAETAVVPAQELSRGRGLVLLVDDEEIVRQVGMRMLEGLGYRTITLKDGAEAVRHYAKNWRDIDVVMLDMVMPSLGGRDCFMALRLINPKVRVVLTSGYGQDGTAQEIIEMGGAGFIQKPYQLTVLADVVNRALAGSQMLS